MKSINEIQMEGEIRITDKIKVDKEIKRKKVK